MRDLPQIIALYNELDLAFEEQRGKALDEGDAQAVQRIEAKQLINDQAYFVLCWGQLEAEIDDVCRDTIRKGRGKKKWEERRLWELYNPDDKRLSGLSFEERTAIVLQKGEEGWKLALTHYQLRNRIAHGNLQAARIDVSEMVHNFYLIQAELRK